MVLICYIDSIYIPKVINMEVLTYVLIPHTSIAKYLIEIGVLLYTVGICSPGEPHISISSVGTVDIVVI
jgi:hypothetical protein